MNIVKAIAVVSLLFSLESYSKEIDSFTGKKDLVLKIWEHEFSKKDVKDYILSYKMDDDELIQLSKKSFTYASYEIYLDNTIKEKYWNSAIRDLAYLSTLQKSSRMLTLGEDFDLTSVDPDFVFMAFTSYESSLKLKYGINSSDMDSNDQLMEKLFSEGYPKNPRLPMYKLYQQWRDREILGITYHYRIKSLKAIEDRLIIGNTMEKFDDENMVRIYNDFKDSLADLERGDVISQDAYKKLLGDNKSAVREIKRIDLAESRMSKYSSTVKDISGELSDVINSFLNDDFLSKVSEASKVKSTRLAYDYKRLIDLYNHNNKSQYLADSIAIKMVSDGVEVNSQSVQKYSAFIKKNLIKNINKENFLKRSKLSMKYTLKEVVEVVLNSLLKAVVPKSSKDEIIQYQLVNALVLAQIDEFIQSADMYVEAKLLPLDSVKGMMQRKLVEKERKMLIESFIKLRFVDYRYVMSVKVGEHTYENTDAFNYLFFELND